MAKSPVEMIIKLSEAAIRKGVSEVNIIELWQRHYQEYPSYSHGNYGEEYYKKMQQKYLNTFKDCYRAILQEAKLK